MVGFTINLNQNRVQNNEFPYFILNKVDTDTI